MTRFFKNFHYHGPEFEKKNHWNSATNGVRLAETSKLLNWPPLILPHWWQSFNQNFGYICMLPQLLKKTECNHIWSILGTMDFIEFLAVFSFVMYDTNEDGHLDLSETKTVIKVISYFNNIMVITGSSIQTVLSTP